MTFWSSQKSLSIQANPLSLCIYVLINIVYAHTHLTGGGGALCHSTYVEVRRQLYGLGSHFPSLHGFLG